MADYGSYIELEFPRGNDLFKDVPEANIIKLNTCRAAISHAIRCYGVKKVWIAKYQCDRVKDFLLREGYDIFFYDIDDCFKPILETNDKDSAIVLTNYFGILGDKHFDSIIPQYNNVIIDNAQALFYHPRKDAINCYSPRKFVASPDGAYVIGINVNRFTYEKDFSSDTSQFLLMRYEYGCDGAGYANKKENDKRIDASPIKTMSDLTFTLLDSFDYKKIIEIRKQNFKIARKLFDDINELDIDSLVTEDVAPMGYPLLRRDIEIIPEFHKKRIFQARFWEYMVHEFSTDSRENIYAKHLALICTDQRYGGVELEYQHKIVMDLIDRAGSFMKPTKKNFWKKII